MKWMIRILITAALSIAVALCLSWLPHLTGEDGTFSSGWLGKGAKQLTEQNVADLIVQMPVQLRIRKVELNHSILSVDLHLPQNAISADVYRLSLLWKRIVSTRNR
jgi:hypothetical protein